MTICEATKQMLDAKKNGKTLIAYRRSEPCDFIGINRYNGYNNYLLHEGKMYDYGTFSDITVEDVMAKDWEVKEYEL